MDAADVSKATAYRRLGELEDAGLIESKTVFDPDGHHHEQFAAVVESVDIQFGTDGLSVSIETEDETEQSLHSRSSGQLLADD
jgi:Fe2+ or Zn2+ uptake regulation protein